jgi:hypothetical protein
MRVASYARVSTDDKGQDLLNQWLELPILRPTLFMKSALASESADLAPTVRDSHSVPGISLPCPKHLHPVTTV